MKALLRLFRAIEIKTKKTRELNPGILKETIKKGFLFPPEIAGNYTDKEINNFIEIINSEIGLSAEQMNQSFHKSWKKVKDSPIEQLFFEQILHYFTTYGFENLGIYDKDSVYIPNEKLAIPELKEDISLIIIKGYTKQEIKEKLMGLLQSGIALKEETINDVVDIAIHVGLNEGEIKTIKNKETRVLLYDYLDKFPENPTEFLRFLVYKSIDKTLLIKNAETISEIKSKKNLVILNLLNKYHSKHGFKRLAEIFYRYKPIFLGFKTSSKLNHSINKIRRLAVKYHKPMPIDYLNSITAMLKKEQPIKVDELQKELSKVNVFRKIRLAYALKFRTKNAKSILYRIRNGKAFSTDFSFEDTKGAELVLGVVINSIIEGIKGNIEGKKIYIPENITYSLPATEKQFTGFIPSGSYAAIPNDMVFGIHWQNVNGHRIDLDLSMFSAGEKIGWDSRYRTEGGNILFSGDLTNAPEPKGAAELYYVAKQKQDAYIIFVNFYNFNNALSGVGVPFDIVVAKEKVNSNNFSQNYMIDPNNVIIKAKTKINQMQMIFGLLVTEPEKCKFYFAETNIGRSITSLESLYAKHSRNYLFDFYTNTISLNEILEKAGVVLTKEKKECDIDLSPKTLEKDSIINLLI